jgi:hypothetical protein
MPKEDFIALIKEFWYCNRIILIKVCILLYKKESKRDFIP